MAALKAGSSTWEGEPELKDEHEAKDVESGWE